MFTPIDEYTMGDWAEHPRFLRTLRIVDHNSPNDWKAIGDVDTKMIIMEHKESGRKIEIPVTPSEKSYAIVKLIKSAYIQGIKHERSSWTGDNPDRHEL